MISKVGMSRFGPKPKVSSGSAAVMGNWRSDPVTWRL